MAGRKFDPFRQRIGQIERQVLQPLHNPHRPSRRQGVGQQSTSVKECALQLEHQLQAAHRPPGDPDLRERRPEPLDPGFGVGRTMAPHAVGRQHKPDLDLPQISVRGRSFRERVPGVRVFR